MTMLFLSGICTQEIYSTYSTRHLSLTILCGVFSFLEIKKKLLDKVVFYSVGVSADPWCFISPNDPEFLKSSLCSGGCLASGKILKHHGRKNAWCFISKQNTPEIQKFRGVSNLGCMTLTISR